MIGLNDSIETTVHSVLHILKELGGKADFHKVFKIMYFADQKHLVRYGTSVSTDTYIAMGNGPVPSMTYDILKALRGEGLLSDKKADFEPYFELENRYIVSAKINPDLDNLSETELKVLDEAISENEGLDFNKLTKKSHDAAWNSALRDGEINTLDIAKSGGADKDMLQYIGIHLENMHAELG